MTNDVTGRPRIPAAIWILLGGQLLVRGAGFAYPFLSYLLAGRGYDPSTVGLVLAVFGGGWVAGQVLTGWLTDRLGRRGALVTTMGAAAVALPVLATTQVLPALLLAAALAGAVYDAPRPIIGAAIADLLHDDPSRAKVNGWRHFSNNVGGAVTGAAGGLLGSQFGIASLFWINAVACAVFAVMALRFVTADRQASAKTDNGRYRAVFADSRLWLLIVVSLGGMVPIMNTYAALPLLMHTSGLSASVYGVVQAANAVTVIALTPVLNPWLARKARSDKPMVGILAAGCAVLGLGMGASALGHSALGYGAGVVASVPGEIAFFVASSDVLNRIAPAHLRGRYNGLWGMTGAVASIVAPLLASWSLTHGGKPMVAATTVMAGLLGAAVCALLGHSARRPSGHRPVPSQRVGDARDVTAARSVPEPRAPLSPAGSPSAATEVAPATEPSNPA